MAAGVVLAAVLAIAALVHDRRVTATSCTPLKLMHLELVSVSADGAPAAGAYNADVRLYNRGPGVVRLEAWPAEPGMPVYSETYRAPAAPAP
jgi:hypothetical protein